jgi:hypothetical protein
MEKTPAAPQDLTPQQALSILIQGVNHAQSKGVYSLDDAELLAKAVRVFVTKPEEKKDEAAPVAADATPATPEAAPSAN